MGANVAGRPSVVCACGIVEDEAWQSRDFKKLIELYGSLPATAELLVTGF